MAMVNLSFQNVTPAGERPPYFPAGLHSTVISKVEDDKPKNPGEPPAAFYVYFRAHPTEGRADAKGCEARERFSYGEKGLPFLMHLLMAACGYTVEQLQANKELNIDPCAPGVLVGRKVFIDARPQSRPDATDPNKKYDATAILTAAEYTKLAADRAAGAATASAANTAAANVLGGGQQQAAQQTAQQPAAQQATGLPGMNGGGLPGMGGGLPGMAGASAGGGLPGMPAVG